MRGISKEEAKQALRTAALSRRNSLIAAEAERLSRAIQARAIEFAGYYARRSVVLYSAIQNEVRTDAILAHALKDGKKVFYPRIAADRSAGFFQVLAVADLHVGRFGVLEPPGTKRLSKTEYPELTIFVPGVAFDACGNRLGRGQGWYDRLLRQMGALPTSVALAYEFQIVDTLPTDPWDQKVQYVITESRVIDCAAVAAGVGSQSLDGRGCCH